MHFAAHIDALTNSLDDAHEQLKSCVSSLLNGNTTTVSASTTHHNLLYNTDSPVLHAYKRLGHDVVVPKSQFKMEWNMFERDVLGPLWQPAATTTMTGNGADGAATATADLQEMYACVTITMEPKLVPRFVSLPEGAAQGQLLEDSVDHGAGGEGHCHETGS
ncbi:hypothetical protein F5148DRAFT_1285818 [Russula earlei]|uniref:Uncharacterized protein n=1 Tax=Russula earlei TaxID=71964 RepID=A0ACC0U6W1_9AGAM|nr:hypothetical protein F5148DRAFT_1285818 [Russula earlei]